MDDFTAEATGYHPVSSDDPEYKMEGGYVDKMGNPIFTLDMFKRGEVPFVTVAADPTIPYGTVLQSPDFPGIPFHVRDTGSAFKGKGLSRIDIARDTSAGANSDENNGQFRFTLASPGNVGSAGLSGLAMPQTGASDASADLANIRIGEPLPSGFGPPDDSLLSGLKELTPIGTGAPVIGLDGEPIGYTEPTEDAPQQQEPQATNLPLPKPSGALTVEKQNEDGTLEMVDGNGNHTTYNPRDGSISWTIKGETITRFPNGKKRFNSAKPPRIYHNPSDDKTYDLTDPSNPKEINFPSSSGGVSDAQQRKIFDKAVAEKGELRSNYPEGEEGEKAYLAAGKSKLDKSGTSEGSLNYANERAKRVVQSVDELMGQVSRETAGIGSLLSRLPETKARNFKAQLDTLKANIAFGELTEMRNASKTGGALGQVSNIELGLLESTLGALDAGQSPENLKQQLAKVKSSIERWNEAKQHYGAANVKQSMDEGNVVAAKEANETKRKAGLKWLDEHPGDPRAEEIRKRLELLP